MKSNMSTYKNYYFIFALILLVIFLSTCSSKEDSTTESTTSDLTWPKAKGCDYSVSDLKTSNFSVLGLAFVQTHVIDSDGCRWQVENNSGNEKQDYELHLVGYRDALVLVEFDGSINSPKTICYDAQENKLVELLLELPDKLPGSDHGINDKFHENIWSGTLPKECFIPGSQISFKDGSSETSKLPLKVGAPTPFKMINLPFYLFGANEQTLDKTQSGNPSLSHALTKNMKDTVSCEFREKLPIAEWQSITHPIKKFVSDYIIVSPRNNQGPKRITNSDEQGDGYAVMSAVLNTLSAISEASGELIMSTQFYAPIMMLNGNGEYIHPGGGLGGGHRGTGDYLYKGIFFHEQGHAFGIPHVGEQGLKYPYPAGSLKGSAWGYDAVKKQFLSPFIPDNASGFANCADRRQLSNEGKCFKNDPMWKGAGDQNPNDQFTMFSDFDAAKIQTYFEGGGEGYYSNGRIIRDNNSSTGYAKWDNTSISYKPYIPITKDKLPEISASTRELDTIVVTFNFPEVYESGHADNTSFKVEPNGGFETTQIYPPYRYLGIPGQAISADDTQALTEMQLQQSLCYWHGCDFVIRFTYSDGTKRNVLPNGLGFRDYANGDYLTAAKDTTSYRSYQVWGVSVPTEGKNLSNIQIVYSPKLWEVGLTPSKEKVVANFQGNISNITTTYNPKTDQPDCTVENFTDTKLTKTSYSGNVN